MSDMFYWHVNFNMHVNKVNLQVFAQYVEGFVKCIQRERVQIKSKLTPSPLASYHPTVSSSSPFEIIVYLFVHCLLSTFLNLNVNFENKNLVSLFTVTPSTWSSTRHVRSM